MRFLRHIKYLKNKFFKIKTHTKQVCNLIIRKINQLSFIISFIFNHLIFCLDVP